MCEIIQFYVPTRFVRRPLLHHESCIVIPIRKSNVQSIRITEDNPNPQPKTDNLMANAFHQNYDYE